MAVIGDPLTFTYTVTSSSGDAGIKDGTSNTIMFGEVVQSTSRLFVGNLTFDSHDSADGFDCSELTQWASNPTGPTPGSSEQVAFVYLSQPMGDVPTTKITLCHEGFDVV
jgi:hypothetical protein